ncbi:class I SAM-dependent methyltransferase [Angustibacter sp. McL0619]|uniref:class I SAM-dependent methyltransferase n=1 Tax=Angustibacter sp. McL0619 TaxID=3415676 RepID=UPI003CF0B0BE
MNSTRTTEWAVLDGPGERALLTRSVRELAPDGRELNVLEAGCGKRWPVDLDGVPHRLTGVDTDTEALKVRRETRGDLDVEIVGDLRTVELGTDEYDVVYCSYVLEHVAGAELVMDRFVAALRPGGRLIIRIPDADSVYGWVTRRTPFWFHVAYKRYVKGNANAGRPGYGPYPTVYDDVISRRGLEAYAGSRGLGVVAEYGTNHHLGVFGRGAVVVNAALHVISLLSFGRLSASHNNVAVVLQKPLA